MTVDFSDALGVDVGGTKLLVRHGDRWIRQTTGPGFGAAALTTALREVLATARRPPTVIGIAVPGMVRGDDTVAACDVLPALEGWSAAVALAGLGATVQVVNDCKAALLATTADLGENATAVTVMAGTAIGCGVLVDGALQTGALGWAGELGYWPVRTATGWQRLDEACGGGFMAADLGLDGATLARHVEAGEPRACERVRHGGETLGAALAGLVNLLNPQRMTVGGGALRLPGYWAAAEAALRSQSIPTMREACEVVRVDAVEDLVAQGAVLQARRAGPPAQPGGSRSRRR